MFVALQSDSGKRLTSIASEWISRPETLRTWARDRRLVCPGCRQPLWFRVGETRRPHFAHRQSASCPLAHDSNEVREAKANLYEWLETKFPGMVELDFDFGIEENRYPSDLFVAVDDHHRFAYWVFDRPKRFRHRYRQTGEFAGVHHHILHTESALSFDDHDRIQLSASHRDFASQSSYDAYDYAGIGHLHFLDSRSGELRIYRGLIDFHGPAGYTWEDLRSGPLPAALISPTTGEIVFPEDVEARRIFREEEANQDDDDDGYSHPAPASHPPPLKYGPLPKPPPRQPPPPAPEETVPLNPLAQPLRCEDCGEVTTEWSEATPGKGTCVCRPCLAKRHAEFRKRKL